MQSQNKLFAFKLAGKLATEAESKQAQKTGTPATAWKVRDGVAVAGCTAVGIHDQYRDSSRLKPNDSGQYC